MRARTGVSEREFLEARLANYQKTLEKTPPAGQAGIRVLIAEVQRELAQMSAESAHGKGQNPSNGS